MASIEFNIGDDYFYEIASGDHGPLAWGHVFLPHYFDKGTADFHYEMMDLLENNDKIGIAAPRDHAKSTLASLVYALFRLCVYKEPYTIIISDTFDQAAEHIGNVFNELIDNQLIKETYPHTQLPTYSSKSELRTKKRETDLITAGGQRIRAFSHGTKLRGRRHREHRPTLAILDDLENDQDVENTELRQKLWKWFLSVLLPAVSKVGKIVIVGTILHWDSLLNRIMNGKIPGFVTKLYSAINEDGSVLWPGRWTLKELNTIRLRDEVVFSKEYLNNPIDEETAVFKYSSIKNNRIDKKQLPQLDRIVIAVDPNTTSKTDSDECGIIAIGLHTDFYNKKSAYVLNDHSERIGPERWARKILDLYKFYNADAIIVEINQGGEMVIQTLKSVLKDNEFLPRIITVRAKSGQTKSVRAEPVSALYETGVVHHVGTFSKLEGQLISWRVGQKSPDRMDALVYGIIELLLTEQKGTTTDPVVTYPEDSRSFESIITDLEKQTEHEHVDQEIVDLDNIIRIGKAA